MQILLFVCCSKICFSNLHILEKLQAVVNLINLYHDYNVLTRDLEAVVFPCDAVVLCVPVSLWTI